MADTGQKFIIADTVRINRFLKNNHKQRNERKIMSTVIISKETVYPLHRNGELIGRFTIKELSELHREIGFHLNEQRMENSVVERIICEVCEEFKIDRYRLLGQSKDREVAYPRQIAMVLTLEFTHGTLNQVRRWFNKKDHATVSYAKNVISARERDCVAEARVIDRIRQAIKTAIKAEEKPETNGHGI